MSDNGGSNPSNRGQAPLFTDTPKLLSAVFNACTVGLLVFDPKGCVVSANPAAERIYGWSASEMIGQFGPGIREQDKEVFEQSIRSILAGEVFQDEVTHVRRDGTEMKNSVRASRIMGEDGSALGVLAAVEDISTEYEAQEAAAEAEERYRSLQENLPVGVFRARVDGELLAANPALADMFGFDSVDDIMRTSACDCALDADEWQRMLDELDKNGDKLVNYTSHLKRKDGSQIWVSSNLKATRDESGKIAYIDGVDQDFTERHEAEEQYRALQDNLPVGIFRTTPEGKLISVNPAAVRMYGFDSAEEMMSKQAKDYYVTPNDRQSMVKRLETEGKLVNYISPQRRKDGSIFWVSSNMKAVRDETGKVMYIDGVDEDYTERYRAELARRESEEKTRLLFEHVPSMIAVISIDGEVRYVNSHGAKSHEATREEMLGTTMWDWFPKEVADSQMASVREVISTQTPIQIEADSFVAGSTRTFYTNVVPFRDAGGSMDSAIIIATDITDRREAERARKQSEEFNRAVIENSPLGVSVRNRFGRLLSCNPAWQNIWEVSENRLEIDFSRMRQHLDFDERDSYLGNWQEQVRHIYKNGGSLHIPDLCIKVGETGAEKWVSQFFYAIRDDDGEVERVVILTDDITDRKLAELALRESEERYRIIAENSVDVITRHRTDLTLLYVSPSSERVIGYKPEEMVGKSGLMFIHPDDRDRVIQQQTEMIAKGEPIKVEFRVNNRFGKVVWAETNGRVIIDPQSGEVTEIVAVHRDVTHRVESQQILQEAHDKLEKRVTERTTQLADANEALRVEQESLRQKNIALQELLSQIEDGKRQLASQIQANIDRIVMPYVRALENSSSRSSVHFVQLLKENLSDITSGFTSSLNSIASSLTPRETEVCDMIRKGLTSKQIAEILSTSVQTVHKQRNAIRKKLGLGRKKVNLATYLSRIAVDNN